MEHSYGVGCFGRTDCLSEAGQSHEVGYRTVDCFHKFDRLSEIEEYCGKDIHVIGCLYTTDQFHKSVG